MRINLNNQQTIDKVVSLCGELDITNPTQLIYHLIEQAYNNLPPSQDAQGCKENGKQENTNKNNLY